MWQTLVRGSEWMRGILSVEKDALELCLLCQTSNHCLSRCWSCCQGVSCVPPATISGTTGYHPYPLVEKHWDSTNRYFCWLAIYCLFRKQVLLNHNHGCLLLLGGKSSAITREDAGNRTSEIQYPLLSILV